MATWRDSNKNQLVFDFWLPHSSPAAVAFLFCLTLFFAQLVERQRGRVVGQRHAVWLELCVLFASSFPFPFLAFARLINYEQNARRAQWDVAATTTTETITAAAEEVCE